MDFTDLLSSSWNTECHIREHCIANLGQINSIGRDRCQQVRIERHTDNGTALTLYTEIDVHDMEPDVVLIDNNPDDLRKPLEHFFSFKCLLTSSRNLLSYQLFSYSFKIDRIKRNSQFCVTLHLREGVVVSQSVGKFSYTLRLLNIPHIVSPINAENST